MRALRQEEIEKSQESGDREFRLPNRSESTDQEKAIRRVADAVHQLNELIQRAVKAGVSVELMRIHRHHSGTGNWGDQMVPLIRESKQPKASSRKPTPEPADDSKEGAP